MKTPYQYGQAAHAAGLQCVPSFDREFMQVHLKDLKVGEGLKPLQQWVDGWHTANVQEKTINRPIFSMKNLQLVNEISKQVRDIGKQLAPDSAIDYLQLLDVESNIQSMLHELAGRLQSVQMNNTVILVRGGLAEVVQQPSSHRVTIIDYDNHLDDEGDQTLCAVCDTEPKAGKHCDTDWRTDLCASCRHEIVFLTDDPEEIASCADCGLEYHENEVNMVDYDIDLCVNCESHYKQQQRQKKLEQRQAKGAATSER